MPRRHDPIPPRAAIRTLGQLAAREPRWVRLYCETLGCGHHAALPLAPLVLRWGPTAPRRWLLTRFRCTRCGARSTSVNRPSVAPFGVIEEFPANLALPR